MAIALGVFGVSRCTRKAELKQQCRKDPENGDADGVTGTRGSTGRGEADDGYESDEESRKRERAREMGEVEGGKGEGEPEEGEGEGDGGAEGWEGGGREGRGREGRGREGRGREARGKEGRRRSISNERC